MGKKKNDRINAGNVAAENRAENEGDLLAAQTAYDTDMAGLRGTKVTDFYKDMEFSSLDTDDLRMLNQPDKDGIRDSDFRGKAATAGLADYEENERSGFNRVGDKLSDVNYAAQGTNVGQLQRGANTGLSNVFNNLQVSTAGAEMAAQEADQSLAASQDLAAQAGTGAGGATALAAAAAKSKQGIAADIDRQVKSNEQLRAQGEQGLQRDLLAQGNTASSFDLNQGQFNVGAQNTAAQFGAQARNQARQFNASSEMQNSQFNAGQTNQRNASMFGAQNDLNKFNAGQSNAERMASFGALQNANAANAGAFNNALAQNAQGENQYNMNRAAGQTQAEENAYGKANDLVNISTNELNNQNETDDALGQIIAAGDASQASRDSNNAMWNKFRPFVDPLNITGAAGNYLNGG